jgi:hypothetical protein
VNTSKPNTIAAAHDGVDECYRCGYALRGIADEQPCPECGLPAGRSRRPSDALHHTRPRWLGRIARGTGLILLSLVVGFAWVFLWEWRPAGLASVVQRSFGSRFWYAGPLLGIDLAGLIFLAGVFLLTSREGYPPADAADRRLRAWLRVAAAAPLALMALQHLDAEISFRTRATFGVPGAAWWRAHLGLIVLCVLACVPLPLLLFRRLRGLAARARSAHLAEHCTIVGLGASASVAFVAAVIVLVASAAYLGADRFQHRWSRIMILVVLVMLVSSILFTLWSLYLLVRFAIAFHLARRRLRAAWAHNDRSLGLAPT